jgi:AcrR family transcriptional regulator
MPHSHGTTSRRLETRRRLTAATIDVVSRKGFYAASVDDIAKRAGYSIGALYSNFTSKDELLFAAFDEHLRWFERQLEKIAQADDAATGALDWLESLSNKPDQFLVFIEFWGYAVRKPKLRVEFAERMTEMRQRIQDVVEQRSPGESPTGLSPDFIALLMLAIGRGLALEALVDPGAVPNEDVAKLLAAMLG